MESGSSFKMMLREYLQRDDFGKGSFLDLWVPDEDEYILWRRPTTIPMTYCWHDQDELLRLVEMDNNDPAKQAFLRERNWKMYLWSFHDWNLRYPSRDGGKTPGVLIPVPTIDDDKVLRLIAPEMAGLLLLLHNHLWFGRDPLQQGDEEPQGDEGAVTEDADVIEGELAGPATLRARPGDDPKSSKSSRKVSRGSLAQAS